MRTIKLKLNSYMKPVETGLPVTSPLPSQSVKQISPFILLEHQGPFTIMPGQKVESSVYPNAGFESVSLLFQGDLEYRDGFNNNGSIAGDDIQWMTAGSGLMRAEKIPEHTITEGGTFHLVKIGVNLPQEFKMTKPKYQDIKKEDIPVINEDGAKLRVIAGELDGNKSPVSTFTPIFILHGKIKAGKGISIPIPEKFNASLYVTLGQIKILGEKIDSREMVWFNNDDDNIWVSAIEDSEFLLLSGEPIDEPMVQRGTFVMNSDEEIQQANRDAQRGKMGMVFI